MDVQIRQDFTGMLTSEAVQLRYVWNSPAPWWVYRRGRLTARIVSLGEAITEADRLDRLERLRLAKIGFA